MIFIYRNWTSTRWQWSVKLYKNRKETTIRAKGDTIHKKIQNYRIHKIENKPKKSYVFLIMHHNINLF
jgi:hypothetical protein